jgi:hypothetical protein
MMAAYPSYAIGIGSSRDPESGIDDDFAQTGVQHSRIFHGLQYYRFRLIHNLTLTEYNSLLNTYAAGPRDNFTFTYWASSPTIGYTVKFLEAPTITENRGLNRFEVQTLLRGYET